jgi:CBS domain-containing protein
VSRLARVLVPAGARLRRAMEAITAGGLQVALVVDDGRLVGLLTDGDCRKALTARGLDLDAPVEAAMNRTPVTAPAGIGRDDAVALMRGRCIPSPRRRPSRCCASGGGRCSRSSSSGCASRASSTCWSRSTTSRT